jgi:predicted lipopolysaccharide heptosyltransferase III
MKTDESKISRILVIRFHLIGDVLLVTPLLEALRRRFPDSHIAMLTDSPASEVIKGHPAVNELIVYSSKAGKSRLTLTDLAEGLRALRLIRRRRFDLVINLHPGWRGAIASWFSGAACRVGYDRHRKTNSYYTVLVPYRPGNRYRVDYLMDTLRAIGLDAEAGPPSMHISDEDREFVRPYVEDGDGPIVAVHPGRPQTRKNWMTDRFAAVADALASKYGARVIFVGAPAESERVDQIMGAMQQPSLSLAGKLSLKQLGALLERSDLFIGIDSAPLHIASAVGTPTVALFGFSDPVEWNPPGARHIVIHKPLPDHPCNPPHCCEVDDSPCMRNILVEDVLEAAESLLAPG